MNKKYKCSDEVRRKARERMRLKRRAEGIPEKPSDMDRFMSKVKIDSSSGCWVWTAHKTEKKYGEFGLLGKVWRAHRASWHLHRGEIPKGMSVLHRCDNPSCVNPQHLFLGDQRKNMHDMISKGRSSVGEKHGNSKLTEDAVRSIRSDGRPLSEICEEYGISPSTASLARRGLTWKHVS